MPLSFPSVSPHPPIDPLGTMDIIDDFLGGAGSSGQIGALGWNMAGGTATGVQSEASHPGILRRDTSASSGIIAYTRQLVTTAAHPLLGSDSFDLTFVFRLNTNDANTTVRLGLSSDYTTLTPTSGIYLEKVDADTSWFGVTRATTQNRTAALAAVDTGWHKVRIRRIDSATIGFTLDALAEVAATGTVPVAGMQPGTQISNSAAASKTLDHDLIRLIVTGLVR